jgi:hypothetical protein
VLQQSGSLFWDNVNSRLGIGTASPGITFVNNGGSGAVDPTLGSGAVGNAAFVRSGIGLYIGPTSNGSVYLQVQRNDGNTATYPLRLNPVGGNVLIGTSTDAGYKLDVNGSVRFGTNFIWDNTNSRLGIGTASPTARLFVKGEGATASTTSFRVENSTNTVAINYTDAGLLSIGGTTTSDSGIGFRLVGTTTTARLGIYGTDKRGIYLGNSGSNCSIYAYDYAASSARPLLLNEFGGNVLIGTTTDAGYKLDVVGADARINGLRIGKGASQIANNTIIGANNGNSITTGSGNTFIGSYAGNANNSGAENVFIGISAGQTTSSSSNNTAVGSYALLSSNANSNSAFGWQAGTNSSSGNSNCFFGLNAGLNSTTGSVNIFLGVNSGRFVSDGTNNILVNNSVFLGSNSRALANNQTNQIVIGESAIGAGSNTATLGNTSIVDTILRGRVNIQQYATGSRPTYVKGALIYDSTLGKLVVGGNAGWEVVTSA